MNMRGGVVCHGIELRLPFCLVRSNLLHASIAIGQALQGIWIRIDTSLNLLQEELGVTQHLNIRLLCKSKTTVVDLNLDDLGILREVLHTILGIRAEGIKASA